MFLAFYDINIQGDCHKTNSFWVDEPDEVVVYGPETVFHDLKMAGSVLL
jgi:hypothetical protein